MLPLMACMLVTVQQDATTGPSAAQLARIMDGLLAPIRDLEMVCEGSVRFVDEADPARPEKIKRLDKRFQTSFAYRRDGAAYQDIYKRKMQAADAPLEHTTEAFLAGTYTKVGSYSNQKPTRARIVDNGSTGSLIIDGSPLRFLYFWKWERFIKNFHSWSYDCKGWESVDGHRCLHVEFSEFPNLGSAERSFHRIWIDLDRGGHILKEEFVKGSDIWYRVRDVKLKQFTLPGGETVWFPVHGVLESFANGNRFLTTPVLRETYEVVAGSVVFNQGLPDERFSVDWNGSNPKNAELAETRKQFQERQSKAPDPPKLRTDPKGVAENLDRMLDEADKQSRRLDASAPSRRTWNVLTLSQTFMTLLGVGVLVLAVLLKRRVG